MAVLDLSPVNGLATYALYGVLLCSLAVDHLRSCQGVVFMKAHRSALCGGFCLREIVIRAGAFIVHRNRGSRIGEMFYPGAEPRPNPFQSRVRSRATSGRMKRNGPEERREDALADRASTNLP